MDQERAELSLVQPLAVRGPAGHDFGAYAREGHGIIAHVAEHHLRHAARGAPWMVSVLDGIVATGRGRSPPSVSQLRRWILPRVFARCT
jgi:hypothetical protein